MIRRRWKLVGLMVGMVLVAAGAIVRSVELPAIGAGGLLHPFRRSAVGRPPDSCEATLFDGVGVQLEGMAMPGHGGSAFAQVCDVTASVGQVAGERSSTCRSASPTIARAPPESSTASPGADSTSSHTIAAHGGQSGAACTYGFYEKQDLPPSRGHD